MLTILLLFFPPNLAVMPRRKLPKAPTTGQQTLGSAWRGQAISMANIPKKASNGSVDRGEFASFTPIGGGSKTYLPRQQALKAGKNAEFEADFDGASVAMIPATGSLKRRRSSTKPELSPEKEASSKEIASRMQPAAAAGAACGGDAVSSEAKTTKTGKSKAKVQRTNTRHDPDNDKYRIEYARTLMGFGIATPRQKLVEKFLAVSHDSHASSAIGSKLRSLTGKPKQKFKEKLGRIHERVVEVVSSAVDLSRFRGVSCGKLHVADDELDIVAGQLCRTGKHGKQHAYFRDWMEEPLICILTRMIAVGVLVTIQVLQGAGRHVAATWPGLSDEKREQLLAASNSSDTTLRRFLLGRSWTFTATGTGGEFVDPHWNTQGQLFIARTWQLITCGGVTPSLLINLDESFMRYRVPGTHSWSPVGAKVSPAGSSSKGGVTVTPVIAASGALIGMQLIPDKIKPDRPPTNDTVQQLAAAKLGHRSAVPSFFRWSYSADNPTKWQTTSSLQQLFRDIILPYVAFVKQIERSARYAVVILDVAPAHIKGEFRDWLQSAEVQEHVRVIFVPPNCTSRLQPLDLSVQRPLKHGVRVLGNKQLAEALCAMSPDASEEQLQQAVRRETTDKANLNNLVDHWLPQSMSALTDKVVQSAFHSVQCTVDNQEISLLDCWTRDSKVVSSLANKILAERSDEPAFEEQPALKRALSCVDADVRDHPCAGLGTAELRALLRSHGMKVSGRKSDLLRRLHGIETGNGHHAAEQTALIDPEWAAFETLSEAEIAVLEKDHSLGQYKSFRHFRALINTHEQAAASLWAPGAASLAAASGSGAAAGEA
tara:strand:+ start:88 stop:2568 length:2481 start_codon:yes stop_codon:yes gene_type:complete